MLPPPCNTSQDPIPSYLGLRWAESAKWLREESLGRTSRFEKVDVLILGVGIGWGGTRVPHTQCPSQCQSSFPSTPQSWSHPANEWLQLLYEKSPPDSPVLHESRSRVHGEVMPLHLLKRDHQGRNKSGLTWMMSWAIIISFPPSLTLLPSRGHGWKVGHDPPSSSTAIALGYPQDQPPR